MGCSYPPPYPTTCMSCGGTLAVHEEPPSECEYGQVVLKCTHCGKVTTETLVSDDDD